MEGDFQLDESGAKLWGTGSEGEANAQMGLRPKIESMKSSSSRTGAGGLGTRGSRGGSDDNRGSAVKENSAGKGEP